MPAKNSKPTNVTKPKQKSKAERSTNKIITSNPILYITVGVIILGIASYFVWTKYQDKQAENVRIEQLNQSGVALDKVKKSLDASGIDAQVKRLSYCWRTGEKTGPGFRYCDQRLVVYGTNKTETEQLKGIEQAVTSLGLITSVRDLRNQIKTFESDALIAGENLSANNLLPKGCLVRIAGHTPEYGTEFAGKYTVDVKCSKPISSRDIYPKGENYGPMAIFEGPY